MNRLTELRHSLRRLFRERGVTLTVVLTLALGIGANSAIFTLINTILLRPLDYPDPDRIITVWESNPSLKTSENEVSLANYLDWRAQSQAFAHLGAYEYVSVNLTGGEQPERVQGVAANGEFLAALGTSPQLGRFISAEDVTKQERVAVLSYQLWQSSFAADRAVLGRVIQLNGNEYRVGGVMPESFRFPRRETAVWLPFRIDPEKAANRSTRYVYVLGRLKPGAPLERARAEMVAIARRLEQTYPSTNHGWTVSLVPLQELMVGKVRPVLWILLGTTSFVLLIALVNVMSLLLARAAAHEKELAVRAALGAKRGQLVLQLLMDSMVLAILGGGAGLLLAYWSVGLLRATQMDYLPRLTEISLDGRVLGFTLAVSLLTGIVFGFVPAFQNTGSGLQRVLKEGARSVSGGLRGARMRSGLVIAEIALALLLVIGAGLMLRSLLHLQQVDPGFNPENVLTFQMFVPDTKYPKDADAARLIESFRQRIAEIPSVTSVGATTNLPLGGSDMTTGFILPGRPTTGQIPQVKLRAITPGYFAAMQTTMLQGRPFESSDTAAGRRVAIVNRAWVRKHWDRAESPIGQRLTVTDEPPIDLEIVGVVGDVRHAALQAPAEPELYLPMSQYPFRFATMVVRTSAPATLVPAIREALRELDPAQPIAKVRPLHEVYVSSFGRTSLYTRFLALFAAVALALAAVGTYGVMAYSTAQRSHEIGIRIALGADRGDILRMIVGRGMSFALGGIAAGLIAAFLLTRVLTNLLYGIRATDLTTFGGTTLLLIVVALLACYLPARRATAVNPVEVLQRD